MQTMNNFRRTLALSACLLLPFAAPAAAEEAEARPFTFAVMGCAHMGVCEARDFALAATRIREQRPELVVFLGGMVDIPRSGDIEGTWNEFDAIVGRLGVPVYDVPGSCTWGPLFAGKEKQESAAKCFLDRYKKRFYSFEHKNNLFIALDSEHPDGAGELSAEQVAFLKKSLAEAERFDNVFVFLHDSSWMRKNPGWAAGLKPETVMKIRYVFSAKEHFFNAENADGVTYLTTGSPPCSLKRGAHPVFYHFLMVSVEGTQAHVNVVPMKTIPMENVLGGKDRKGSKTGGKGGLGQKVEQKYQLNEQVLMDSAERKLMLPAGRVVEAVGVKPGMNIVDVGAGVGVFSFPFAEALNGTGNVFATETDPKMLQALAKEKERLGLTNFQPVGVTADGVDQFYKHRTFDAMFFCELYHYLLDPVPFFSELRPSLAKDTGRLFIVHFRNIPDFTAIEFDEFRRTLQTLKLGQGSPFFGRLSAGAESFVKNWEGAEAPPSVREAVVRNFNDALNDPGLFNQMLNLPRRLEDNDSPERGKSLLKMLFPRTLELARWLITELESGGVFEKRADQLTEAEKRRVRGLNRILLTGAFKMDKLDFIKGIFPIYVEKERIAEQMKQAGYALVREHEGFTYHHFLEFKRAE